MFWKVFWGSLSAGRVGFVGMMGGVWMRMKQEQRD